MRTIDFSAPADEIAPQLIGATLWHGPIGLRITEVEAYLGEGDPASHAFRGPRGRAVTMFGEPGRLYVYLSYGIHYAANVVCSPAGSASAVLLRSADVIAGLDLALRRRGWSEASPRRPIAKLASGPGNLGAVLGLCSDDNGAVLGERFRLEEGHSAGWLIRTGPRTGISKAADLQLRYWLDGSPSVSLYRRSPRAPVPEENC